MPELSDPQAALLAAAAVGGGTPSQVLARAAKYLDWLRTQPGPKIPEFGFGSAYPAIADRAEEE